MFLSRNKNLYYIEWVLPRNNKMYGDYDSIVASLNALEIKK